MQPATLLVLLEVDAPLVKLALPLVKQGDKLKLSFVLSRQNNGRTEVLDVKGEYRVVSVLLLAEGRQEVGIESTGKAPSWRSVKRRVPLVRKLSPARFPATLVP